MDKTTKTAPQHVLTVAPRHVLAFRQLNLALADFLNQAFDAEGNWAQVRVDHMLGQVEVGTQRYLELVSQPEQREPAVSTVPAGGRDCTQECTCDHDPLEIAYDRYVETISGHSEPAVAKVPPVALDLIAQERVDFILKVHGLDYPVLVTLEDDGDPAIKAWNLARASRRLELQRIGVLFFLGWQAPSTMSKAVRQSLEEEVSAALEYLLRRAGKFRETEKELAWAIGGEALEITRADMLDDDSAYDA